MSGGSQSGGHGHVLFRLRGIPVHTPPSALFGVILIAWLWSSAFDPIAGTPFASPVVIAVLFSVLLYVSIVIHEVGHAFVARAFGCSVHRIVLWVLGGVTYYERAALGPAREAAIAAAGPAGSLLVAGVSYLGARAADDGQSPVSPITQVLGALALANLFMAIYNLIPGIPLDGGAIFKSLVWAITRSERRGTIAAAYSGFACAGVIAVLPLALASARGSSVDLVSLLLSLSVAVFVAMGASAALRGERLQDRMGTLTVAQFTRRAIPVPGDTPLAEALRRQSIAQAGALVIVGRDLQPPAIAQDAAISAVPTERRPWVPVSSVSRELPPKATLTFSMKGADMLSAMQQTGASEYLVVDDDGLVVGVLMATDVAAAIRG